MKSAYHLHRMPSTRAAGEPLEGSNAKGTWKAIWRLKVPNAIKIFIRRACKNVLTTASNLSRRNVIKDDTYTICKKVAVTVGHVLRCCIASKDV